MLLKSPFMFSLLPPFSGEVLPLSFACSGFLAACQSPTNKEECDTANRNTAIPGRCYIPPLLYFPQLLFLPRHITFSACRATPLSKFSAAQVQKNEIIWISCVNTPLNFDSNTQIIAYCEKPSGIGCFPTRLCPERIIKAFILGVAKRTLQSPRSSDHRLLLLRLLQFQPQAPSPPQCCLTPITSPGPRTITASCALTRERQRSPAGS